MELDNLVVDRVEDGRRPKVMSVVSELTRRCLSVEAERSLHPKEVVKILRDLFTRRGEQPSFIRSYNGREFEAQAAKEWCGARGADTLHRGGLRVGKCLRRYVRRVLRRRTN